MLRGDKCTARSWIFWFTFTKICLTNPVVYRLPSMQGPRLPFTPRDHHRLPPHKPSRLPFTPRKLDRLPFTLPYNTRSRSEFCLATNGYISALWVCGRTRRSLLRRAHRADSVRRLSLVETFFHLSGKCQQLFDEYTATISACTQGNYRLRTTSSGSTSSLWCSAMFKNGLRRFNSAVLGSATGEFTATDGLNALHC